jgi:hypothetical protein
LRVTALVAAAVLGGKVVFVAEAGGFAVFLADAAGPKSACFGLGFAIAARDVLVWAGDSRFSTIALGNSSATCSIASSRASIASTESSMRATCLEGDRLIMSLTKESGPSPAGNSAVTIRAGVRDVIDSTNESSVFRSEAWPADDISA